MEIIYTDVQIIRMSKEEIEKLGLLNPKKVFFQMETSGSPSAWTNDGEFLIGHSGSDIVKCAERILEKEEECAAYNQHAIGDNRHNYDAHIRVVF